MKRIELSRQRLEDLLQHGAHGGHQPAVHDHRGRQSVGVGAILHECLGKQGGGCTEKQGICPFAVRSHWLARLQNSKRYLPKTIVTAPNTEAATTANLGPLDP